MNIENTTTSKHMTQTNVSSSRSSFKILSMMDKLRKKEDPPLKMLNSRYLKNHFPTITMTIIKMQKM